MRMKVLRELRAGEQIAFVGNSSDMRIVETMKCRGYGKFTQRMVLLVDPSNCSTWQAIMVTCVVPTPEKKKRGPKEKEK